MNTSTASKELKEEVPKKIHISPFSRTIIDISELDSIIKPGYNHGVCGGII